MRYGKGTSEARDTWKPCLDNKAGCIRALGLDSVEDSGRLADTELVYDWVDALSLRLSRSLKKMSWAGIWSISYVSIQGIVRLFPRSFRCCLGTVSAI